MIATARVHRLPALVADAIAAGEVVERPASVVKELIENAIDAGASCIDVVLEGGGLVRIAAVDDGHGIAPEDLDLALERHATSKIDALTDLEHVRTLGFRGEALASIAAVSDLRLVSCVGTSHSAMSLHVRCGELVERGPAAAPPGTRVEVCELFASTPARLRFLRSTQAESGAAARVAADLALTHPEVAISCRSDGKVVLRSPGDSMHGALRAVFGARAATTLIDVDEAGAIAVRGAISEPAAHRAARGGIVLVVNGRRVQDRALQYAVEEAYSGLIPTGRHPFGLICVELDPASVDVNVHPAKREVRFKEERGVFTSVQRACWSNLRASRAYTASTATGKVFAATAPSSAELELADGTPLQFTATPASPNAPASLSDLAPLRALGQVGGEWMVAAAPDAVVLVDPHAAHEKVLYAELRERWDSREQGEQAQLLLIPVLLHCDTGRLERFFRHRDFIASCGFAVEPFGPDVLRCTAVPAASANADPEPLLAELIDSLEEVQPAATTLHRAAALIACHSAVRFGDRLEPDAQQHLLDRVVRTPGGTTCPHGRPALVILDDPFLRRAFRRPPR